MKGIALDVASEDRSLLGAPGGFLMVMWPSVGSITMPNRDRLLHETAGWIGLIGISGAFWWLAERARVPRSV